MKSICSNNTLEEIFKVRIEQNSRLFTEEEKRYINENFKISKKIYFLGLLDSKKATQ